MSDDDKTNVTSIFSRQPLPQEAVEELSNITKFTGETTNDLDPADVLLTAIEDGDLTSVLIIGQMAETPGLYISSSTGDIRELLFMLEVTKQNMMNSLLDGWQ